MESEMDEQVDVERAVCRHCANPIYRGGHTRNWRHAHNGKTACLDLLGNDRRARPTRQYEERVASR